MRRLLLPLAAGLALAGPLAPLAVPGALAQQAAPEAAAGPDFGAWERQAAAIEAELADPELAAPALEARRQALVDWRGTFQAAQGANNGRIDTLRGQVAALGPAPAEGATEAPEIAARRTELAAQITQLETPGIAAVEAYSRADNLVRQIDGILRDRQTEALLEVWPSPLNPVNWPAAAAAVIGAGQGAAAEVMRNGASDFRQANLRSNLPLIGILLAFAAVVLLHGRRWMERLTHRLQSHVSARGSRVAAQIVSLGQVLLPLAGVVALSRAIRLSGMTGTRTSAAVQALPMAGLCIFAALWLAGRLFPAAPDPVASGGFFNLGPERRREARIDMLCFGVLLALRTLSESFIASQSQAVAAILTFPLVAVAGILLFRLGQILRLHARHEREANAGTLFRNRMVGHVGTACIGIGLLGPLLAAVGYVPAANALVYPAGLTLALLGLVMVLQMLVGETYAVAVGEEASKASLIPVLIGFVLMAMAMPVAALVWGVRSSYLAETWLRFREGFELGGIRISPTMFLTFAVVFAIGYTLTKLVQGALRSTILPKTRLDEGGQKAVISGMGYIGVVLAAIFATTTAGIDLSSLAILAGALSVGIGFGLQNIVQNFVSGIILLIERPVSEGDWIEVGGVQGRVRAISVRSTRIETFDRNHVIVPNASLVTGTVTNWTRFTLAGRLLQEVTVSGVNDGMKVQQVLEEIARTPPMVILNPPPSVGLIGIEGGNLTFEMRLILRDVNFKLLVKNEVLHLIVKRFAEEGIAFGVMGMSKTIMADGEGNAYVLPGARFGDLGPAIAQAAPVAETGETAATLPAAGPGRDPAASGLPGPMAPAPPATSGTPGPGAGAAPLENAPA